MFSGVFAFADPERYTLGQKTYRDFAAKTDRLVKELDDAGAEAELVADYAATLFSDEAAIADFAKRNRNAAARVYERIREWSAGVRGDEERVALARAQRVYAKALRETRGDASGERRFSFVGVNKDGVRMYETDFDASQTPEQRKKLFKDRIASIFNLGAIELRTDIKKITVNGDKFTAQKNIYGDQKASNSEKKAKVDALYDLVDILATAKFESAEPEPSYIDAAIKPKNQAHKGVKYWYKFGNDVIFDGVPYHVTFSIRDNGTNGQYQYLIDFKEKTNEAHKISHTAETESSLRRASSVLRDNSIPQAGQDGNSVAKDVT